MLRTNTNKYRANVKKYILESIDDEWGNTDKEKLAELKAEFERVANHPYNLQRHPNHQDRLADYLSGLPINLDYTNYDILQRDKQLRQYNTDLTDKQADRLLANYWSFMAYQIMRIW